MEQSFYRGGILKHWNDKCAVFGIWNHEEASLMAYIGLFAQQHRGQEGAGIVSSHQSQHFFKRGFGLVGEVFNESSLKGLKGNSAIGHTRYSTQGESKDEKSLQPLVTQIAGDPLAVAHNGQITNFKNLQKELMQKGVTFHGTGDSECLIHLLNQQEETLSFVEKLKRSLQKIEGAYSLVLLLKDALIVTRDVRGFRPLVLGKKIGKDKEESLIVASETCALDLLEAEYIREIEPGEILVISKNSQMKSYFLNRKIERRSCIFESIYFARPDSLMFGQNVYEVRQRLGRALAQQAPVNADLVIPVPDSGVPSAIGFSQESQIPFELGIIRNHYVGRTFIYPISGMRDFRVKLKLSPQKHLIQGKKVVVVDDSLVRGTTSGVIVKMIRQAGAREIHFRVTSPPVISPCYYGIDTPRKSELISSQKNLEELRSFLEVDSIEFLSIENLVQVVDKERKGFCTSCFTGRYPTQIFDEESS